MKREEAIKKILELSEAELEKALSKLTLEEIEELLEKIEEVGDNNE